jgi:prevent-host-death family protein
MRKTITLREANQAFSRCIREVEAGEEITITRRGQPIAQIVPVRHKRVLTRDQEKALDQALKIMEEGWDLGIEHPLDRDALHAR